MHVIMIYCVYSCSSHTVIHRGHSCALPGTNVIINDMLQHDLVQVHCCVAMMNLQVIELLAQH